MSLRLIKPNRHHVPSYRKALKEWPWSGINPDFIVALRKGLSELIARVKNTRLKDFHRNRKPQFLEFWLVDGRRYLGTFQIRNYLAHGPEVPKHLASHLYFDIRSSCRGKGNGNEILRLGLKKARIAGFRKVIAVTAANNLRCQAVLVKNGGRLIGRGRTVNGQYQLLKYRFDLRAGT